MYGGIIHAIHTCETRSGAGSHGFRAVLILLGKLRSSFIVRVVVGGI